MNRIIVLMLLVWSLGDAVAQELPICTIPEAVPIQLTIEEGLDYYKNKNWELAKQYFRKAIQESSKLPCLEQTRWLQRSVLRADFSKGDFVAFNAYYEELLTANNEPKDREQAIFKGRLLLLGSKAAIVKRNWKKAEKLAQQAQDIQEKQAAWLHAIRSACTRASIAYYQGDYQQMELSLDKAFDWQQKHLRKDLGSLQHIMNLYGIVYYEIGDYEKAVQQTLKAIENNLQLPKEKQSLYTLAQSYNNLALYYMELGDIYKAKDYCNNALQIYHQQNNHLDAATTYLNLGEFFDRQKKHEQALFYYEKGKKSLDESKSKRKDRVNRALVILNNGIASTALQLERYSVALRALTQNLTLHKQGAPKKEETLSILADYYIKKQDYTKAVAYHQEALAALQALHGAQHPKVAQSYLNLARLFEEQGKRVNSAEQLEAAAQALQAGDSLVLEQWAQRELHQQVETHAGIWLEILQQKARLLLVENDLKGAYQTAQNALLLLENQRQQLQEKDSKLFLIQTMLPTYEIVVETALSLHQKTQEMHYLETAFAASERSKALLLLDALKVEKARTFGQVPDSLLNKERRWARAVLHHKKQLLEANRSHDEKAILLHQERLLTAKRCLEKLQAHFEITYPDYYQLKYKAQTARIKEVQGVLDEQTVLVEYFVGEKAIYIFSITKDRAWSTTIKKDKQFGLSVKALRNLLTNIKGWEGKEQEQAALLARYSRSIYQHYLEQALPQSSHKRLIVIPDGLLTYIPFEVLLTKKPHYERLDVATLPYLLNDYSISYHYSASLHLLTQQTNPKSGRLLALASSYTASVANDTSLSKRQRAIRAVVNELPGTIEEVQQLETHFAGDYFYKQDANEASFKQQVKENRYSVIHLAMHGLVDAQLPDYSGLLFTYSDNKKQDDLLHAYELNLLTLKTDLVVLSACETGFGRYERGEGVVSIGRGFMYAGAPSLLLTLWPLNDATSVHVIASFYEALEAGMPKDIALQQTKKRYLEQFKGRGAHPFFWASFVQFGNTKPIILKRAFNYYQALGWGALIIFLLVFIIKRQNR